MTTKPAGASPVDQPVRPCGRSVTWSVRVPPMLCKPHRVPECPQCKKGNAMADGEATGDVRELRQMLADCDQYLKEGETPAQRIERERRDTEAVLNLLIREKQRTEAMREVMLRMIAGIDHLAEIARQWEPDHSSGADRRGCVLAKDARDDAARLLKA